MNGCLKRPARAGALMVLACLLLLAGCGRTVFVSGGGYAAFSPSPAMPSAASLFPNRPSGVEGGQLCRSRARTMWWPRAALPTDQRALAWERVAGRPFPAATCRAAQNALKFWKDLVPGAENSSAWLDVQSKLSGAGGAGQPSFSSGCVALALPLSRSVRAVRQQDRRGCPRPRRVNCPSPA